jgi:hypothetical protein
LAAHAWVAAAACTGGVIESGDDAGPRDDADAGPGCPVGGCDGGFDACDHIVCAAGQACVDGRCRTDDRCANVACSNPGEVCDPRDGACHAGGADDDGDGVTIADGDCHDGDPTIRPGASEACDGVDQDCDLEVDEGFPDVDRDGYDTCGFGDPAQADCDDADASRRPGLAETCDGADDDCDGDVDEGLGARPCASACGPGEERCEGGGWRCSAPETCDCTPAGASEEEACGFCGTRRRTCRADLSWEPWGECAGAGECAPGATEGCATACGSGGTRRCGDGCAFGECTPPEETCNLADDDCDGACDEGCRHPIHRSYNPAEHDHTYNADLSAAACCGNVLEAEGYFYLATTAVPGTTELFLCYVAGWTDHFVSTSSACEGGAAVEGSLGYIATSPACGTVPLYRVFDPVGFDHMFTIWEAERATVLGLGWVDEGLAGYVWTSP